MPGKTGNAEEKTKITPARNALAFLLAAAVLLTGCGQTGTFDGSRTSDGSGFRMEYTLLDRQESAALALTEGEQIQVSISHAAGNVDLTVGQEGEAPIYRGTEQENAEFILTVPKTGSYRITVTGHRANGKISFARIPAEDGG